MRETITVYFVVLAVEQKCGCRDVQLDQSVGTQ